MKMTHSLPLRLLVVLALPARVIHELLHALTALPWAERVQIELRRDGNAAARIAWKDDQPPRYAIVLSALAPLFAGVLAVAVAVWGLATGQLATPTTPTELALGALTGAYVAMIANVQREDRRAALGAGGDRDESS